MSLAIPPQDPCSSYAWVAEILQIDWQHDPFIQFTPRFTNVATQETCTEEGTGTVTNCEGSEIYDSTNVANSGGAFVRACVRTKPTQAFPQMYIPEAQNQFQLGAPTVLQAWKAQVSAGVGAVVTLESGSLSTKEAHNSGTIDLTDNEGNGILVAGPNLYIALYAQTWGTNWTMVGANDTTYTERSRQYNYKIYFRYKKVALQEYLQMVQWQSVGYP